MPTVGVERRGDVAVLTLKRPDKLNALSSTLEMALLDAVGSDEVAMSRAIVIQGAGRAFSAGADTGEISDFGPAAIAAYYRGSGRVYEVVAALPQVTISAIHGYCLGAGLELALATDLRVADSTTVFGLPEVGIGIVPSSGGIARLVRLIGPAKTREFVLLGERFDAATADRLGLLTSLADDGQALDRALELAATATRQPALAVSVAKKIIDAAAESPHASVLLLEQLAYGMLNQAEND